MLYYYYKPYGRVLCAPCVIDIALCRCHREYSSNMSPTEVLRILGFVEVEKYFRERNNSEKDGAEQ